jgi:ribosome-associated protein
MALTPDGTVKKSHGEVDGDPAACLAIVLDSLEDSKAEEIVAIDVTGKTPLADHMVVASGRSHRHVGAIADHLLRDLKTGGVRQVKAEGLNSCDWVLVDAGDVVVHIFRPEVRTFYNLEKMWQMESPSHVELVV